MDGTNGSYQDGAYTSYEQPSYQTQSAEPQSYQTQNAEPQSYQTQSAEPQSYQTQSAEPQSYQVSSDEQQSYQVSSGDGSSSSVYYQLLGSGVSEVVATQVNTLIANGILTVGDINEKVTAELADLPDEMIGQVSSELSTANLDHLKNKGAYLIGLIKTHKKKVPGSMQTSTMPAGGDQSIDMNQVNINFGKHCNTSWSLGPNANENAIKALLQRTGYKLELSPGQRQYGPSNWEGEKPGKGCEVFIGGLLHETFEDSLVPMLEDCGTIFDLRIMANSADGTNKGFAFCIFSSAEEAKAAVAKLNGKQMNRNRTLKVNVHSPNTRLFVGGVDKSKDREEILYALGQLTEGLTDVILKSDTENPRNKHRGFVFLDYYDHKSASQAIKKIMLPSTLVFGRNLFADWAAPLAEASEEVMAAVKVLYVKGLSMYVTEDILKDRFSPYGTVDSVKKLKDYAFVHFQVRDHALQAMNDLNGTKIEDSTIEVTLAKPGNKKKDPTGRGGFAGGRGGFMMAGRGAPMGGLPMRGRGGPPMARGFGPRPGIPRPSSSYGLYGGYSSTYRPPPPRAPYNGDGYSSGYGDNYSSGYDSGYADTSYRPAAPPAAVRGRGNPRGAAMAYAARGRGVPPPPGAPAAGIKRPATTAPPPPPTSYATAYEAPAAKKPKPYDWGTAPIPQQPLATSYAPTSQPPTSTWYTDSY